MDETPKSISIAIVAAFVSTVSDHDCILSLKKRGDGILLGKTWSVELKV